MRACGTRRSAVVLVAAIAGTIGAVAPFASACQADTATARFEAARLAEESERDFARAAQLFQSLGADTKVDPAVRGKAWLHAASSLHRLGREEEAKQALQQAVALGGDAAVEAKRLLEGGAVDERLARRIERAVTTMTGRAKANAPGSISPMQPDIVDLVWIGEPAVGAISAAIEGELDSPSVVALGARFLIAIGGDAAAAELARLIASDDVVLRRSVLDALRGDDSIKQGVGKEPVRSTLLRLTHDAEPRIRSTAIWALLGVMNESELTGLLDDPEYQLAALRMFLRLPGDPSAPAVAGPSPALLAAVRRFLDTSDSKLAEMVTRILKESDLTKSREGSLLFLDALGSERFATREIGVTWAEKSFGDRAALGPPPEPERWVDVARRVWDQARRSGRDADRRGETLGDWFDGWCVAGRDVDPWPQQHATVIQIGAVGGFAVIERWIDRFAAVGDLPDLIDAAVAADAGKVVGPVIEKRLDAIRAAPEALQHAIIERLAAACEANGRQSPSFLPPFVHLGLEASDAAVLERARRHSDEFRWLGQQLLDRPVAASDATLEALLMLPSVPPASADPAYADRVRQEASDRRCDLVVRLAERSAAQLPVRMAEAYQVGLARATGRPGRNEGNLVPLFAKWPSDGRAAEYVARYPSSVIAAMLEACSRAAAPQFWGDLVSLIQFLDRTPSSKQVDDTLREIGRILPRIAEHDDSGVQQNAIEAYLIHRSAGWQEFAAAALGIPKIAPLVVADLAEITPELWPIVQRTDGHAGSAWRSVPAALIASSDASVAEAVFGLLEHPLWEVRRAAVDAIAERFPDRLAAAIEPLAGDGSVPVRTTVAITLRSSFDRAAIPLLIGLLRDNDDGVRKKARESLESLQYYFESKLRWERVLSENGIDSANAAEALLKQAMGGATPEVRRIAIESLGTLKVPETLPVLIQLMSDPDPSISAAAKAAITKING